MPNARRVAANTLLALLLNLSLRASGTLAFILIGRLAGPTEAGIFSLSLGYLAILNTLFLGLDDVLVRECTRTPERLGELLASYGVLRIGLSVSVWLGLLALLGALGLYSIDDWLVIAIVAGSVLLETFSAISQAAMQALGDFTWPLVATLATSIVRVGGAVLAMLVQAGIMGVAVAWPIGSLVGALALTAPGLRQLRTFGGRATLRFNRTTARQLWRTLRGFSAVSILAGLEYQLDVVLLSILLSMTEVAWYSAAVTIVSVVLLLSQAYRMVLFPALVKTLHESPLAARRLLQRSVLIMLGSALPIALGTTWLAPQLVSFLYGDSFNNSAWILQVLIWSVVFFFLNVPLVRFLLASGAQSTVWRMLLVSLSVNVAANLILIPQAGGMGSAYARLASSSLFCILAGWQTVRGLNRLKAAAHA